MQLTDYSKLTCSAKFSSKAEPVRRCEAHEVFLDLKLHKPDTVRKYI